MLTEKKLQKILLKNQAALRKKGWRSDELISYARGFLSKQFEKDSKR